ncbi:MAG: protein kinase, partial [Lachnospiraceae bacterium]|nr:protein kinase [Lachnospiraceae bacterium]
MNLQNTYTDIVEIGSGGGGTVFRAYHVRMRKHVVLKKIHSSIQHSIDIRRELDILKKLKHSYLPTVLDFIEDNGSIFTVMDYVEGESFESLLNKGMYFSQQQVIKYAGQIGEVLVYLHGQMPPVVHGDIKPANIMLTPEDNICLIDFNISHVKNGNITFNMGYTPGYAAPEQSEVLEKLKKYISQGFLADKAVINGTAILDIFDNTVLLETENSRTVLFSSDAENRNLTALNSEAQLAEIIGRVDERSDIYSVGATLYALLLGKPLVEFHDRTIIETVKEAGASEGLAQLISKCMRYEPKKRFQSAGDFLKAVKGIAKVDKRFRRLVRRQETAFLFCMIGFFGFVLLSIFGHEKMEAEKTAVYNGLLSEMAALQLQGGNAEEFDRIYQVASTMFPEHAGAYYQKALYLYYHRQYTEMIAFILQEVLANGREFSAEENGDFYYLLANGYMETEDLESAVGCYQTAIQYNPYDNSYYIDYAITLARYNRIDEAAEALGRAVELGISNDKVLLAQGEMKGRQQLNSEAADCFRQCIGETEDAYVRFRAYVMWGKLNDGTDGDVDGLLQKVAVLEEGAEEVNVDYQAAVLEQLTQAYIDLGDFTGNIEYYTQAIEQLNEIIGLGWDT